MPENRWQKSKGFVYLSIFVLTLWAIIGSSFRFADGNSGRYLPNLYLIMDSNLFPNDPVVEAFGRFKSSFYSGLGHLLGYLDISVFRVKSVFYALHAFSKLALMGLLYFLLRGLKQGFLAYVLIGAWAVHQKGAAVGGDSMFAPSMTHATLAVLLGIAALGFLVRNKPFWFWTLLCIALFMHSLIAVHLALIVLPVILIQKRGKLSKSEIAGAAIFSISFFFYYLWMTPPAFSPLEADVFLSVKGGMSHISPQAQPILGWVKMTGLVVLALLAYHCLLSREKVFKWLAGFVIAGALLAPACGLSATLTQNLLLAQLQPLRMFTWINLLVFILLVSATVKAWKEAPPLGVVLLIVILLNVLDSLWGLAWLYFAIGGLILHLLRRSKSRITLSFERNLLTAGGALLALIAVAMCSFGEFHDFESFRDPVPVLTIIICLPLFWVTAEKNIWRWSLVGCALIFALIGRSFYVHDYIKSRQCDDFDKVCEWIAENTDKETRFITAVKRGGNFSARALRTSVNEGQSALYWVAPFVAKKNGEAARRVYSAWDGQKWNMDALMALAHDWKTEYIIIDNDNSTLFNIAYKQGIYKIVRLIK